MKSNEIMEKLQNGAELEKQILWFAKDGKTNCYYIGNEKITQPQFEKIHHLLTKVREERNFVYYKLKP